MKVRFSCLAALLIVLTLGVGSAWANPTSTSFVLNNSNFGSSVVGPYVQVQVYLDAAGTSATVSFTALTNGGNTYNMMDGSSMGLNVAGDFQVTSSSGFIGGASYPKIGSGNVSGFGNFNLTLDNKGGFADSQPFLSVTLSGNWSDASQVLTANDKGATAVSHIAPSALGGCTGFASNGVGTSGANNNDGSQPCGSNTVVETPEPNSLLLLGSGLLGLAGAFRRRAR